MRREAAREALGFLLLTATMFSIHLISALVLVYCTMATAGPTSDAWFMKEMAELVEVKEQMDEEIKKGREDLDATEIEATETKVEQELDWLMRASTAQITPQSCTPEKPPRNDCNDIIEKFIAEIETKITKLKKTIKERRQNQKHRSCEDLDQNLPSGYYDLLGNDGKLHNVYCQMEEFGGDQSRQSGGWMRLAAFSPGKNCPGNLVKQGQFCKRPEQSSAGCFSVVLQTNGISYSRVYGKIIGIQEGSTDAFEPTFKAEDIITISDPYIDGISLTYGSPDNRAHIWSFASQYSTTGDPTARHCYCRTNSDKSKQPSFVHDNYFCDTGVPSDETQPKYNVVYSNRPLWDSCGSGDLACCSPSASVPPWFYREIGETCSDIEMRVCTSQGGNDEDVFIKEMEIYVQ